MFLLSWTCVLLGRKKQVMDRGTWVAPSVARPPLASGSDHDMVRISSPALGAELSMSLLGILCLPLSLPLPCLLSHSLSLSK